MSWKVGLRIVDLGELARQMYCKECSSVLDLNRTEGEEQFGLASVLEVVCLCGVVNRVRTGRLVQQERHDEVPSYDINVKASIGMLAYNDGEKTVISFLSALNIPASGLTIFGVSKHRGSQHQNQGDIDKAGQGHATNEPQSYQGQGTKADCLTYFSDTAVSREGDVKVKDCSGCADPVPLPELGTPAKQKPRQCSGMRRKRKLPVPRTEGECGQTLALQPKLSETLSVWHTQSVARDQNTAAVEFETDVNVRAQIPAEGADEQVTDRGGECQQLQPKTPVSHSQSGHCQGVKKLREIHDGGSDSKRETTRCRDKDDLAESVDDRPEYGAGAGRKNTRSRSQGSKYVHELEEFESPAMLSGKRLKLDQILKERMQVDPSSKEKVKLDQTARKKVKLDKTSKEKGKLDQTSEEKVKLDQTSKEKGKLDQTSKKGVERTMSRRKKKQKTTSPMHRIQKTHSEHMQDSTTTLSPMSLRLRTKRNLSKSKEGQNPGAAEMGNTVGQKRVARQPTSGRQEGRKMFRCPVCQRAVQSSRGLSAHLRHAHQHKPSKHQRGNRGKLKVRQMRSSIAIKGDKPRIQTDEKEGVASSHNSEAGQDGATDHAYKGQHRASSSEQTPDSPSSPATHSNVITRSESSSPSKRKKSPRTHFACPQCSVQFAYSMEFTNHMQREHNVQKPHCCRRCSECFSTENQLKLHRKQHPPVEECHECTICLKVFPTGRRLRAHRATHTREERYQPLKRYRCQICSEEFAKNYFLQIHLNYHRGKRPFQCFLCEESFFTKPERRAHYKKCIAKKKCFLCELCGGRFGSVSSLRKHERVHSGEKPHQCRFCEKTFSRTNTLRIHERQHTGETPYVCDQCGSGFKQRVSLVTHMKSKHNINATYYSQPRTGPRYTHEDFLAGKPFTAKVKSDATDDAAPASEDFNSSLLESNRTEDHRRAVDISASSSAEGAAFPATQESTSAQNQHALFHTGMPLMISGFSGNETNKIMTLAHAARLLASASSRTQTPVFPHQFSTRLQQAAEVSSGTVSVDGSSGGAALDLGLSAGIASSAPQGTSFTGAPERTATTRHDGVQNAISTAVQSVDLNSMPSGVSINSDFGENTLSTNSGRVNVKTSAANVHMLSDAQIGDGLALGTDRSPAAFMNSQGSSNHNSNSSLHSRGDGDVALGTANSRGRELSAQPDIVQRDINVVLNTLRDRGVLVNTQGDRRIVVNTQGDRSVVVNTQGDRDVVMNTKGDRGMAVNMLCGGERGTFMNTLGNRVMVVNTQGDRDVAVNSQGRKGMVVNMQGDRCVNTQRVKDSAVNMQGVQFVNTQGDKDSAMNTQGVLFVNTQRDKDSAVNTQEVQCVNRQGDKETAVNTLVSMQGDRGMAASSQGGRRVVVNTQGDSRVSMQGDRGMAASSQGGRGVVVNTQGNKTVACAGSRITSTPVDSGLVLGAQGIRVVALNILGAAGTVLNPAGNLPMVTGESIVPGSSQENQHRLAAPEVLHGLALGVNHNVTPNTGDWSGHSSTVPSSDDRDEEVAIKAVNTNAVLGRQMFRGVAGELCSPTNTRTEQEAGDFEKQEDGATADRLRGAGDDVVGVCQSQLTSLQNVPLYYSDN